MALSTATEADAWAALRLAQVDSEERKLLGRLLAAYDAADQTYEGFCQTLFIPPDDEAHRLFGLVHLCYVLVWKHQGRARLDSMIGLGHQGLYLARRKR